MSDEPAKRIGTRSWGLSLAVRLLDVVTGEEPMGDPTVRIEEVDMKPIVNPSGYYLFFGLPETLDTVTVVVDGGDAYRPMSSPEDFDAMRSASPREYVVELALEPTVAYPFPAGRTVIRGHVWEKETPPPPPEERTPVAGADVLIGGVNFTANVPGRQVQSKTDSAGEFALYFESFTEAHANGVVDDVRLVKSGGDRLVEINGTKPNIVAARSQHNVAVPTDIVDGDVTLCTVELALT